MLWLRIRDSSVRFCLLGLATVACAACGSESTESVTSDAVTTETTPESGAAAVATDVASTTTDAPAPTTTAPPPEGSPFLDGSTIVVEVRSADPLSVRVDAPAWEIIGLSADFDSQSARLAGAEPLTTFSVVVTDESVIRLDRAAEQMVSNPNIRIRRDETSVVDGRDVRTVIGDFSMGSRQGRFMVDLDGVHLLTVEFRLGSKNDLDIEAEVAAALESLVVTSP